jgi:MoaA/NifB/PqqE/SkfB family radical SAM enzyme
MGRWAGKEEIMLTPRDIQYVRALEKKYPYIRTDFQANYIHKGCGAAKEIVYIKPSGEVFCCPFIDIPFGNVRFRSIKKIRKDMLSISYLKEYHKKCIAAEDGGLRRYFTDGKSNAAVI